MSSITIIIRPVRASINTTGGGRSARVGRVVRVVARMPSRGRRRRRLRELARRILQRILFRLILNNTLFRIIMNSHFTPLKEHLNFTCPWLLSCWEGLRAFTMCRPGYLLGEYWGGATWEISFWKQLLIRWCIARWGYILYGWPPGGGKSWNCDMILIVTKYVAQPRFHWSRH